MTAHPPLESYQGLCAALPGQDEIQYHREKPEEWRMAVHATGTFEVKMTNHGAGGEAPGVARMAMDKQFHGDLEADSQGQMLAATSSVKGSAGYVAMEQVTGSLNGRKGGFVLQHSGTMTRGMPHQVVGVVPDSGTGELEGLAGALTIQIADGKHSYDFEYTFDGAA